MRQKCDTITRRAPSATGRHASAQPMKTALPKPLRQRNHRLKPISARATVDAARDEAAVEAGW